LGKEPEDSWVEPSVAVDVTSEGGYGIKISARAYEINVVIPAADAAALRRAPMTPWLSGSVRAGTSAGMPVWWSAGEDEMASVLVGQDDQTWDFGISVPMAAFEAILREIEALERRSERDWASH
jgi:hypothetical protein